MALPIGLHLTQTARVLSQAFERAMAEAGGSASTWQVLLLVRSRNWDKQSELAGAMGVTSATLTHHLNGLEKDGLIRRWREADNRRVQRVELTDAGVAMFDRLKSVAGHHDATPARAVLRGGARAAPRAARPVYAVTAYISLY